MKKLFFALLLFLSIATFAQNASDWSYDYYRSGLTSYSNNLIVAVGDSASGEYYVNNQLAVVKVDSNWTASGIGFMVYNHLEDVWAPVKDDAGSLLEFPIAVGAPLILVPAQTVGLKYIKFYKVSSGSDVDQATNPTYLEVETVRFN